MWHTIVALAPGTNGVTVAKDLIPLPDQADELWARLVAMDRLAQLYPDTFRMLLLAAREVLRPNGPEVRLDIHSRPIVARGER
jgi:hypothetical protein